MAKMTDESELVCSEGHWTRNKPAEDGWYKCLLPSRDFDEPEKWVVELARNKYGEMNVIIQVSIDGGDTGILLDKFHEMVLWWWSKPEDFPEPPKDDLMRL